MALEIVHKPQEALPVRPAVAAPTTVQPRPAPSEAERKQSATDLYKAMGWGAPPEPASAAPSPAVAAAPPVAVAPALVVEPAPSPAPAGNQDDLIRRTASATAIEVARAIRDTTPAVPAPAIPRAAEPEFTLESQDAEDYQVLLFLQQTDQKFAGKADAFLDFCKKRYAYIDEWVEKNAGKEFNPDDAEFVKWEEANSPEGIDEDVIRKGSITMEVDARYNEQVKPRIDAMDAEKAFRDNLPAIAQNITSKIVEFVESVDPEAAKFFKDAHGNLSMSEENIAKLRDKDPITADVCDDYVGKYGLEVILIELEKSVTPGMRYKLNFKSNPVHAQIYGYQQQAEEAMSKAPAAKQMVEGRKWVSITEFNRMVKERTARIGDVNTATTALQGEYWTVTVDDVGRMAIADFAAKAKKKIEAEDGRARKKYGQPSPAPPAPPAPAPAAPAPAPPTSSGPVPAGWKPRPPSTVSQTDVIPATSSGQPRQKTKAEEATAVHFR